MNNKDYKIPSNYSVRPTYEDKSKELEEITKFKAEKEAEKRIANQSIN